MNKEQYISTNQTCPTHETWLAYAENRCDKQQERAMEMHLMDCPLCAEAIDVYMDGQGKMVGEIQTEIKQNIDNQSIVKIISIWKRVAPLAIAASLLLGFFFLKPTANQSETEQIAQQDKNITLSIDSNEVEAAQPQIVADIATIDEKQKISPNTALQKKKDLPQKESSIDYTISSAQENVMPPNVAADAIATVEKEAEASPAPSAALKKAYPSSKKSSSGSSSILATANAYFNAKNYEKAIENYKTILESDAMNQEALFFLGKSEMARDFHQNALGPLESVNSPLFYDEAQWLLAQSYVKSKRINNAKRILKPLSERENQFQNSAKELLKNINN